MESSVNAHSYLKKISGSDSGKIFPLFSTLCTIGRASQNTVCISEPFLSRKHCSIRYENPVWIITDYGGLNGTYLNGEKMESSGYRFLKDKTIVFLGDPEESTCGFIFLTSLPVSAQSSGEGISSSSLVTAPVSAASTSSQNLPSSSTFIDLSSSPPDQSDDVSSTRGALADVEIIRERQRRWQVLYSDNSQPDFRDRFKERIEKLRQMMLRKQRRNQRAVSSMNDVMLSPLNDRMLPILYDASTESPRSTLRSNINYPDFPLELFPPLPISPDIEIISSDLISDSASEANGLEQPRDTSSARRTTPYMPGSSRGNASNAHEFDVLDVLVDSVSDQSDSDCSISSMDSLRTRIRKQKVRSNRALSDKGKSPGESPYKGLNSSVSSDEVELIKPKLHALKKSPSEQGSQNLDDSESLICNMEDEVKGYMKTLGDELSSKPKDSDSLQFLKDTVLRLQKQVLDATEEVKNVLDKNKEQQSLIEELLSKQGVSREQLSEDLEAELSCNICTEVLIKPVILDCGHIFCKYCIGIWKKKKKQCPNCRDPIRTENEVRVLDGYISKVVDRLEPMYRMKRNELIEARKAETAKLKKTSRKRSSPSFRNTGNSSNMDVLPGLRVYHNLRINSPIRRSRVTVRMQHLLNQRTENPLLRRLVNRIEGVAQNQATP